MAMIATTTSSSTRVNPPQRRDDLHMAGSSFQWCDAGRGSFRAGYSSRGWSLWRSAGDCGREDRAKLPQGLPLTQVDALAAHAQILAQLIERNFLVESALDQPPLGWRELLHRAANRGSALAIEQLLFQ